MRAVTLLRTPLPRSTLLPLTARPFSTTARFNLKEDKAQSAQEIEHAKQNQQSKEKRRELSSSSEEVVGAEQEKVKDHGKHMEELQQAGKEKAEGKR